MKEGHIYTIGKGSNGMIALLETQVSNGSGKFTYTGLGCERSSKNLLKQQKCIMCLTQKQLARIMIDSKDYVLHIQDTQGVGLASSISMATLIAYSSSSLNKPVQSQLIILGSFSIGGTINKVENLSDSLQVCLDAGAKKILLPMSSAADIATVPADLFAKFQISFYSSPEDAVIKALGIE